MKTITAAIGVLDTEFFTVYIPKSKMTSLVTIAGEVAIKKQLRKEGILINLM
jgi:hypothetical protein